MQPETQEAEVIEGELVDDEEIANEIALRSTTLFHANDPMVALARMAAISDEIVDVIEQQKFYVIIGAKKYVTCPGWKTAAGMVGLAPFTVWTKPNESQDGYVARVEVRTLDERTIAAAEAECARDEPNWKSRPKHSLRSMAETRATSRALRGPLEQVFALGGYEGTAAEEMPVQNGPPQRQPERASPVEGVKPSREQLEEIRTLVRTLTRIDPDTNWSHRCGELASAPAQYLTHGGANLLIDGLQAELERLNKDGA
jgi:hypothetical protein